MSPSLHIACSANAAFVPHVATMLLSAAAVHASGSVTAHFLHDDSVSPALLATLRQCVENAGLRFCAYQPSTEQLAELPVSERYPQIVWYRVLLPMLLVDVPRVLYLDADTLVLQNLAPIWALNLEHQALAAVEDAISPAHAQVPLDIGLTSARDYFNSGVLLMNLEAMRAQQFSERLLALAKSRHQQDFPDQIALNQLVAGDWLHLHPKWNCMTPFYEDSDRANELPNRSIEQRQAACSPCVVHFEGYWQRGKPWHYRCDHPMQWLYLHYRAQSPWPLQQLEGRTLKSWIAKRIPRAWLDWVARWRG